MKGLLLATAMFGMTAHAQAITINVEKKDVRPGQAPHLIELYGDIKEGDGAKFARVIKEKKITKAVLSLDFDGDLTAPALEIANIIRDKGFTTYVGSGSECHGMCSIVWLSGGGPRYVGRASIIAFHEGNEQITKHLIKVGVSPETIKTILSPPEDDFILNAENAPKLGISFTLWDKEDTFINFNN
jgi:hypothetical protein